MKENAMKHMMNQTEVDIIKAFDEDSLRYNYNHNKSDIKIPGGDVNKHLSHIANENLLLKED